MRNTLIFLLLLQITSYTQAAEVEVIFDRDQEEYEQEIDELYGVPEQPDDDQDQNGNAERLDYLEDTDDQVWSGEETPGDGEDDDSASPSGISGVDDKGDDVGAKSDFQKDAEEVLPGLWPHAGTGATMDEIERKTGDIIPNEED
ncbi:hypothetical protein ACWTU6_27250 [Mesorhizobium sp. BHbsci]